MSTRVKLSFCCMVMFISYQMWFNSQIHSWDFKSICIKWLFFYLCFSKIKIIFSCWMFIFFTFIPEIVILVIYYLTTTSFPGNSHSHACFSQTIILTRFINNTFFWNLTIKLTNCLIIRLIMFFIVNRPMFLWFMCYWISISQVFFTPHGYKFLTHWIKSCIEPLLRFLFS